MLKYFLIICLLFISNLAYGDIYFVRSAGGEDVNATPGYWNHVAISTTPSPVDGKIYVVEYQKSTDSMIVTDQDIFMKRYEIIDTFKSDKYVYKWDHKPRRHYGMIPLAHLQHNCTTWVSDYCGFRWYYLPDHFHERLFGKDKK